MGNGMKWMKGRFAGARELLGFLWGSAVWWLTPLVLAIVLLSLVVVALEGSAVAPFIYTLF